MAWIDGPSCKLQFCEYCEKIVDKTTRGRKKTCSDECAVLYQRLVWNRQHADKMSKDPDYAKKQSARQYERIKSDPELLEKHQITKNLKRNHKKNIEAIQKISLNLLKRCANIVIRTQMLLLKLSPNAMKNALLSVKPCA